MGDDRFGLIGGIIADMSWTTTSLRADLEHTGIVPGDSVLVHSSFKSLGQGGTPADVIEALLDTVGPTGNVLFPTHTWVGAGPTTPPTFDVRTSPSKEIGIIPEVARLWEGGVRSVHPTHSVVAIGPDAGWFTEGHFEGGICGLGSPYDRICEPKSGTGYILLLGVNNHRNTSIHMVEEVLEVPETMTESAICLVSGYDGIQRERVSRFHTWKHRDFMVMDDELTELGIQRIDKVAEAVVRLVEAKMLKDFLVRRLTENPAYFFQSSE